MTVAQARRTLGSALTAALPSFVIFPAPQGLDEITKPTLLLERTRVGKLEQAPQGVREHTFTLFVIVPQHSDEDALDERLDEVLEALDDAAQTKWDDATRATYASGNPCYQITLTTTSNRKA